MSARTTRLISFAALLILAGGCSTERTPAIVSNIRTSESSAAEHIHGAVEIWSWNIAAERLTHLIPEFERRHPGVRVNVNMNGARMQSRLLLALSAGVDAPDISQRHLLDAA